MKRVVCATALAVLAALPAHAEKCALPLVASLDLTPLSNGDYTIPVSIGGVERRFSLGLNNPFSVISGPLADSLGYRTVKISKSLETHLNGETIDRRVVVGDLQIGVSRGKDFQMLRSDVSAAKLGVDGVAALDLLRNFDVELDLAARKLKLFSPNDCQNKAYWASSLAEVKFTTDMSGHVEFAMRLDDKDVDVDFEVTDGPAIMHTNTLKRLFDLTLESPGVVAETQDGGTRWYYPFKSLSIGAIAINNPRIALLPDDGPECRHQLQTVSGRTMRCFGAAELHLRGGSLKALHLYFDFKHRVLYATPADAVPASAKPAK